MPRRSLPLSPKHLQCLDLVLEGLTSKRIAPLANLSIDTVDQYMKEAMRYYGVSSRKAAAEVSLTDQLHRPVSGLELQSPESELQPEGLARPSPSPPNAVGPIGTEAVPVGEVREELATYLTAEFEWHRLAPRFLRPFLRTEGVPDQLSMEMRFAAMVRWAVFFLLAISAWAMVLLLFAIFARWLARS